MKTPPYAEPHNVPKEGDECRDYVFYGGRWVSKNNNDVYEQWAERSAEAWKRFAESHGMIILDEAEHSAEAWQHLENRKRKLCPLCGEGHIDETAYPVLWHPSWYVADAFALDPEVEDYSDKKRRLLDVYDFLRKAWMGIK